SAQRGNVCKKENGLFAHDQYCDYYYECENGVAQEKACPNGLAFAGKGRGLIGGCDYPHRVGCPGGDGAVMGQTQSEPKTANGCTECSPIRPAVPDTGNAGTELLPSSSAHSPFCTTMSSTHFDWLFPAICKDQPNGHIPIEKSCGRFWLCVGGYPRLQRCPAGLAFSQTNLRCELSQNVPGCEPPPPPQLQTMRTMPKSVAT
ncbi:protein obstructor-E, partial [Caerostris extrusa]